MTDESFLPLWRRAIPDGHLYSNPNAFFFGCDFAPQTTGAASEKAAVTKREREADPRPRNLGLLGPPNLG